MDLHNEIKSLRLSKGLSQDELAQKAGLSIRTIQRIENNETKPHGDTIKKIFKVLISEPEINLLQSSKVNNFEKISSFYKYWKVLFFLYFLAIIVLIPSMFFKAPTLGKTSFILSYIFIFLLLISSFHYLKKQWKKGLRIFAFTLIPILISGAITLHVIPYKNTSIKITNGQGYTTERNLWTEKTDSIPINNNEETKY